MMIRVELLRTVGKDDEKSAWKSLKNCLANSSSIVSPDSKFCRLRPAVFELVVAGADMKNGSTA